MKTILIITIVSYIAVLVVSVAWDKHETQECIEWTGYLETNPHYYLEDWQMDQCGLNQQTNEI